ncbi:GRB2-associated-binding protein 1-like [Pungitius pungitius]|uniref:GRB2-associated-binding protein 1-like n=1 Tax=Pungitius pungitius TaxID=134920 RepID=UPI002E14DE99
MSGAGEVVCEGWLRKSPPEKKLRRHAWKRRWFVLRSGRLSGESDVLQYLKNPQARRPIRTINLSLCEQVDAGLSFTKKELESSFVFDLRTEERTWYLVAESEEDMNRWVSSICLLCGFNPTEDAAQRHAVSGSSSAAAMAAASRSAAAVAAATTGSVPEPCDPVSAGGPTGDLEENYLWLSHCQSHNRAPLGSSASLETDCNDLPPPSSSSSSSSSSSPSLLPNGRPAPSSSSSSGFDASVTSDPRGPAGRLRCHPSPHPRKHSLDFRLRPVAIPPSAAPPCPHPCAAAGYQVPRPASPAQPRPPRRPSSPTQPELRAAARTAPPRPPKPRGAAARGEASQGGQRRATLPHCFPELERRDGCVEGGGLPRSNTSPNGCDSFSGPRSLCHRASMFDFSERFNSYFLNKGLVPLGSVCCEDGDVDENYVPMSAATTEPPVAARAPPPPPSDPSVQLQEANYVPMTPLAPSPPAHRAPGATGDPASLGKWVPPPAHAGFRSSAPLTPPPLRRNTATSPGGAGGAAMPPPIHRDLKPKHRRVKPAPLDITPMQEDWQEVPPPVRSPVTRTFTRDPSSCRSVGPTSADSSSPSSDSDDPDDSCVAMTTTTTTKTSNLSFSAGEPTLRLMLHRASEGGVSSPVLRRAVGDKQVEYLDLDLHSRQRRSAAEGGEQAAAGEEGRARGERARVDYVVVDPRRTKALRSTREAWHDGRMSTEKEKCPS